MDMTILMLSFLFGTVGMGMLMYGKKAGRLVPIGAGVALMTVPYFIPNAIALTIVCVLLTLTPVALRNA